MPQISRFLILSLALWGAWAPYALAKPVMVLSDGGGGGGDITAPEYSSSSVDESGVELFVTFGEVVVATNSDGFTLLVDGAPMAITLFGGSGTSGLTFIPAGIIEEGQTVTLAYSSTTGDVEDAAGNDLATFSAVSVTNNSTQNDDVAPIMHATHALAIVDEAAINWTPNMLQGSGHRFAHAGLPTGASGNTSTGAITGTLSTPGIYLTKITAWLDENSDGDVDAGEAYDEIYKPIHVYATATTIDSTWLTANGPAPYDLTTADTKYTLAQDVSVSGIAFAVTDDRISLDLNGHTITYDNATPISIANASFETVDSVNATEAEGWSFANVGSTGAVRLAGDFLDNEVHDGSYSIKFPTTTATGYVVSESTITLAANTSYVVSGFAEYGGSGSHSNPGVVMYVSLVGTGGESTRTASKSTQNTRGIQYLFTEFTTGGTTETYNVRVGITGHGSGTQPAYIDEVRVMRTNAHGICASVQSFAVSTDYPDVVHTGDADDFLVFNGTITQGQDAAHESHAVYAHEVGTCIMEGVTATTNGPDTSVMKGRATNTISALNNTAAGMGTTISSRDNYTGPIFKNVNSVVDRNDIPHGVHGGIICDDATTGTSIVSRNTISLQNRYSNGFCILVGNRPHEVYLNVIDCGTGSNTARGIYAGRGTGSSNVADPLINVHDNDITIQTLATNQEYEGAPLGADYGLQSQHWNGGVIYNNVIRVVGSHGGHAFRLNDSAPTGVLEAYDNEFICDVDANPRKSTFYTHASSVYFEEAFTADKIDLHNNEITSNCSLLLVVSNASTTYEFADSTFRYIDEDIADDYAWVTGFNGILDVMVSNPTFYDAGTKTWMDAAPWNCVTTAADTTSVSLVVANDITATITSSGLPIASTAVTAVDNVGTTAFSGSSNGSGAFSFVAKDFSRINGSRTEHNPFSIAATGYSPITIDLDETDRVTPPSIPLTP